MMKKILLATVIYLFFAIKLFADGNVINKINVEGTQRIDVETVISYSNTSQGEIYSEDLGNQILKNLFDTNLFSNIQISFENNNLNILLQENPTINLVTFSGNSKIKDEDLIIEISLKERSVYSRSRY